MLSDTLPLLFCVQDEHGDVCPANWMEGSQTIKPDPVGSLEYFGTQANKVKEANGVSENGANGHADGTSKKRARVD
jgi:hypothetical protein